MFRPEYHERTYDKPEPHSEPMLSLFLEIAEPSNRHPGWSAHEAPCPHVQHHVVRVSRIESMQARSVQWFPCLHLDLQPTFWPSIFSLLTINPKSIIIT